MFESLSDRLQDVFRQIRGDARLTEQSVETALREIRMALLEADVNFKVVKAFIDRVRDRAVGEDVLKSLTPAQQVVAIVRDEMLALFGDAKGGLPPSSASPRVILLLGLQGSGKTTTSAKLARLLTRRGGTRSWCRPTSAARPPSSSSACSASSSRCGSTIRRATSIRCRAPRGAMAAAQNLGFDTVIVDTAGRLHIDDELMIELAAIKAAVDPTDLLYVADAMTGQDAIKSAGEFNRRIGLTGVVLSKMDGDARGGAALSVVSVVGVPIAFVGSGERLENLEPFHPDRVVSRILGMGDVLSLIEKAEQVVDRRGRRAARSEAAQERVHARRLPRSAPHHPQDGAARVDPRACCRAWGS